MPKLKNLDAPEADFFALDLGAEGERHQGKGFNFPLVDWPLNFGILIGIIICI